MNQHTNPRRAATGIAALALLAALTACTDIGDTTTLTTATSTAAPALALESPAAPSQKLITRGRHCFGGPTAVAAAHARATIALERDNERVAAEAARAGQRPPYGHPAVISEPGEDGCYDVAGSGLN